MAVLGWMRDAEERARIACAMQPPAFAIEHGIEHGGQGQGAPGGAAAWISGSFKAETRVEICVVSRLSWPGIVAPEGPPPT